MGTRARRTLAPFGLRYLCRQLHTDQGKQLPPVLAENLAILPSATSSSVEGRIDGGRQELSYVNTTLLDREESSFESIRKLSMKESFGSGSWHFQNASPSQDGSTDEWSIGRVNGRISQEIRCWTSETNAEVHGDEAAISRHQDLFSRYLQWRRYDLSVSLAETQNYSEAAAVSAVDMDGLVSLLNRQNFEGSCPSLSLSSSLDFLEKPSMVIPLEADSVKRKRKKKMNKHKQRKLRRRDRHRN